MSTSATADGNFPFRYPATLNCLYRINDHLDKGSINGRAGPNIFDSSTDIYVAHRLLVTLNEKKSGTPSRFGEHVPGIAEVYAWILNARAPMISELSALGPNWEFTVLG